MLHHGDIGFVASIDPDEQELTANFDGGAVIYPFGELDELVLCYATTIPKSQGSEYPIVIIPTSTSRAVNEGAVTIPIPRPWWMRSWPRRPSSRVANDYRRRFPPPFRVPFTGCCASAISCPLRPSSLGLMFSSIHFWSHHSTGSTATPSR